MKITPEVTVDTLGQFTSSLAAAIANSTNIAKAFAMLEEIKRNPDMEKEYLNDPQTFAENYIGKIDGVHFHTADANNNYTPAEAGAAAQMMEGKAAPDQKWVRVEVRAGVGILCAIFCGSCDNGK
ncbi:hypothetical protein [Burkholderia ambifaria]|uniref:hypothetical protein n=1 Tax=Burkholderia ambifaria TaxID=152480 RepID=UPI00158BBA79|nr:hypothetical protein [Burkholderia ambifaria]